MPTPYCPCHSTGKWSHAMDWVVIDETRVPVSQGENEERIRNWKKGRGGRRRGERASEGGEKGEGDNGVTKWESRIDEARLRKMHEDIRGNSSEDGWESKGSSVADF
eukprot:746447-Hanusia_phi.AAC.3